MDESTERGERAALHNPKIDGASSGRGLQKNHHSNEGKPANGAQGVTRGLFSQSLTFPWLVALGTTVMLTKWEEK